MTTKYIIPMSSPDLTDAEREAVAQVLLTPNLSMGDEIKRFEESFREYSSQKYAIGVSSGTAGLHLCVRAAGIGPGDIVITTPFSFVASANVVLFEQAIPVFVDVDPITGNINPDLVQQAVNELLGESRFGLSCLPRKGYEDRFGGPERSFRARLKAILPVDVFGQPADMDAINAVARRNNLVVIEDSCEALGATYKNALAGTLGDYGVFAFYPNKQITTGEGAMIITNHDRGAELIKAMRNQGRAPGDTWLQHTYLGYNYRLDEMSAALGRVQMSRLEELLSRRQQVADWYDERLAEMPWIERPQVASSTTRMSWFVYVIRFVPNISRDKVAEELEQLGIPVRPYFVPIHQQPYVIERFGYQRGDFPVAEDLGNRSLALPFSGVMSEAQVDQVCERLRKVLSAEY